MLISQKELLEKFGYRRPGDLRKCLDEQKIPYYTGKSGQIVTTIQALNAHLIGLEVSGQNDSITFV